MPKKGVTLIELMVIIAIIGIMAGVLTVSLSGSKEKKDVEVAAREVAAAVRETQNNALTGKNATGGCNYAFIWTNLSGNYNISGCSSASYTLKNGVVFNNGGNVSFNIPYGNTSAAAIIVGKGGTTKNVCVYATGRIEEKDSACN